MCHERRCGGSISSTLGLLSKMSLSKMYWNDDPVCVDVAIVSLALLSCKG